MYSLSEKNCTSMSQKFATGSYLLLCSIPFLSDTGFLLPAFFKWWKVWTACKLCWCNRCSSTVLLKYSRASLKKLPPVNTSQHWWQLSTCASVSSRGTNAPLYHQRCRLSNWTHWYNLTPEQFYTLPHYILNELWSREESCVPGSSSHRASSSHDRALTCICGWHNDFWKCSWVHAVISMTETCHALLCPQCCLRSSCFHTVVFLACCQWHSLGAKCSHSCFFNDHLNFEPFIVCVSKFLRHVGPIKLNKTAWKIKSFSCNSKMSQFKLRL